MEVTYGFDEQNIVQVFDQVNLCQLIEMATSHTYVLKILLVILTIIYIVYINTQINSHAHDNYGNNTNEAVNSQEVIPTNLDDIETIMQLRRDQVKKTCLKYGRKLKVPLKLYNKRLRLDFFVLS